MTIRREMESFWREIIGTKYDVMDGVGTQLRVVVLIE